MKLSFIALIISLIASLFNQSDAAVKNKQKEKSKTQSNPNKQSKSTTTSTVTSKETYRQRSRSEFRQVVDKQSLYDDGLRELSRELFAKCNSDHLCELSSSASTSSSSTSSTLPLVETIISEKDIIYVREISNVTRFESTDAMFIKMQEKIDLENLLKAPASLVVGEHCAVNTAAAKAGVLLKSALNLPKYLVPPGVVGMSLGVFTPLTLGKKIITWRKNQKRRTVIGEVNGEGVIEEDSKDGSVTTGGEGEFHDEDDDEDDWLYSYLGTEYNKMVSQEINFITDLIGINNIATSGDNDISDENNDDDATASDISLAAANHVALAAKRGEWKKKLSKLSNAISRVTKLLQSHSQDENAIHREAIVLRYIAGDVIVDIKTELEDIDGHKGNTQGREGGRGRGTEIGRNRFPFVVAYAFAFRAELEARQVLGEAKDLSKSLLEIANFLKQEALQMLKEQPITLYSIGVDLAPMLSRLSIMHDVFLSQAQSHGQGQGHLPLFSYQGSYGHKKLLLPRASEAIVWEDDLDAVRYLYSEHADIDMDDHVRLNRVDAMIWYCDFINVAIDECEIGRERIEMRELFAKLGLVMANKRKENEEKDSNDDDKKKKELLDLSILRSATLPAYRHFVEQSINAKFSFVDVDDVQVIDGTTVAEHAALQQIFNELGGKEWKDSSNWNSNYPMGEWFGVTTDVRGHVVKLSLSGNNLKGALPSSLGNLLSLTHLDLGINGITGTLPDTLTQLLSLQEIRLQSNDLHGSISDTLFSSLSSLNTLWLSANSLTGELPQSLAALSNLQFLDLADNSFEEKEEWLSVVQERLYNCDISV